MIFENRRKDKKNKLSLLLEKTTRKNKKKREEVDKSLLRHNISEVSALGLINKNGQLNRNNKFKRKSTDGYILNGEELEYITSLQGGLIRHLDGKKTAKKTGLPRFGIIYQYTEEVVQRSFVTAQV